MLSMAVDKVLVYFTLFEHNVHSWLNVPFPNQVCCWLDVVSYLFEYDWPVDELDNVLKFNVLPESASM